MSIGATHCPITSAAPSSEARDYHASSPSVAQVAGRRPTSSPDSRTFDSAAATPISEPAVVQAARAAGLHIVSPAEPEDRWVTVNGLRLHYLDWGNPQLPALIFLHGFAQQAHSWDFAALALRHRFHCVSLDLRGHGDSDWSPRAEYELDYYVSDVEALVRSLACDRPVVCGLSMGGRTAYTYAARNPEGVRALIVAEAAPESRLAGRRAVSDFTAGTDEFDTFEDVVARTLAYNPRRTPEQVRGSLRHSVRQRPDGKWTWKWDPALRQARTASLYGPVAQWAALSRVRCPTLFVLGAQSEMVAPETVRRMVAAVPGSIAETVENAGHLVAGDNPAGFDAAVKRFFGRTGVQGMPE